MRHLRNECGWVKPTFSIAVLILIVYVGLQFGMPYYRYSAFQSEAREIARTTVGDVKRVKDDVYTAAVQFDVPIKESDITVEKTGGKIRVRTSWSSEVDIFGLYQKTMDFDVDIEE